jgi:hypothetical protein
VYKVFKHIILLFFPLLLFGQQKVDTTYVYGKQSIQFDFTKDEIKQATENVITIKSLPLIVRLKSNTRQINAYRKSGNTKIADKIEKKSLIQNLSIISACIKYFNFPKIYFIDTDNTNSFRLTDTLLTSSLLGEQEKVYLNNDSVLYLDFGPLYNRVRTNEWKYKEYGVTEEGTSLLSETAFVIRNANNDQFAPPTPFYTVVQFGGGKKSKERGQPLMKYMKFDKLTMNSDLENRLIQVNEFDAAILRLNALLYEFYGKITANVNLKDDFAFWYSNNPNKDLYAKWIIVEKRLQSIEAKDRKFTN